MMRSMGPVLGGGGGESKSGGKNISVGITQENRAGWS